MNTFNEDGAHPSHYSSRISLRRCIAGYICLLLLLTRTHAAADSPTATQDLSLIPWPQKVTVGVGTMALRQGGRIVARDGSLAPLASILAEEIFLATGDRLEVGAGRPQSGDIVLEIRPNIQAPPKLDPPGSTPASNLKREAYKLSIDQFAAIRGANYNAVAQGTVTLLQAIQLTNRRAFLPRLTVEDAPHFEYCGAMLDVARKPYSIDTLRQCVRVCRYYKIRYLHLHLSDENAWVFPSTAFPTAGSTNYAFAGGSTPIVYARKDLVDLVAFADARAVTLVPEIEMPGHSGALRGSLAEIFGYRDAAGKRVSLGVLNMVSETAFQALDTLIGEVSDIFASSPFIHIGCDEASLGGMETVPEVEEFLTKHNLKGPYSVFNAFVNRMHDIVKKHGKRMIVWEGAPLEPNLPTRDLILMPWVGGAGTAARLVFQGYQVINAPWGTKTPYFDPYLVNGAQLRRDEPRLIGATSILWEQPQEKAVPYLRQTGALRNEPTYNPNTGRDYADFLSRLARTDSRLDRLLTGLTFEAAGLLPAQAYGRMEPLFDRTVLLTLSAPKRPGLVRVTLDGSEPTSNSMPVTAPIVLNKTTLLRARWFGTDGTAGGDGFSRVYKRIPTLIHDAVGAKTSIVPDQPGYYGPGPAGLTDGRLAVGDESGDAGWVGWANDGKPITITVDIGFPKAIRNLTAHFLRSTGGVVIPKSVEFAISTDGAAYHGIGVVPDATGKRQRGWYSLATSPVTARYARATISPGGDWTFCDEIAVNARQSTPPVSNAAQGKPVTVASPFSDSYDAPDVQGLTDGYLARSADFLSLEWLGIEGKNLEATVDLGQSIEIKRVGAHFLQHVWAGIRIPTRMDILVSDDGKEFRKACEIVHTQDDRSAYLQSLTTSLSGVRGRYVKFIAYTNGQWIFVDELFVNPVEPQEPR